MGTTTSTQHSTVSAPGTASRRGAKPAWERVWPDMSRDVVPEEYVSVRVVLLVDDEDALRSIFKRALQHAGFEVEEAADGQAALAAMERRVPDILITDLAMPRLSGLGLARAMEQDPALAHVPVLFISGHPGSTIPLNYPMLEKPFPLEMLVATVRRQLA